MPSFTLSSGETLIPPSFQRPILSWLTLLSLNDEVPEFITATHRGRVAIRGLMAQEQSDDLWSVDALAGVY